MCNLFHSCAEGHPILCPAGHYCPEGSARPLPCPAAHFCKGQDVSATVQGTWDPVPLAAGWQHTLVVSARGGGWAAGLNDHGQLGNGSTSAQHDIFAHADIHGQRVVAVAARFCHKAVITDSGELWTLGCNGHGQLGVGDTRDRHAPVQVSGNGRRFVSVTAGYRHTAAVTDSGDLWTFGRNAGGQLGVGETADWHLPAVKAARAAVPVEKIGEVHVPLCRSPAGDVTSELAEVFLAATWGSNATVPLRCGALQRQLAAFLAEQSCGLQVGAWEASPCPAGSFCPGPCKEVQCPPGFFCAMPKTDLASTAHVRKTTGQAPPKAPRAQRRRSHALPACGAGLEAQALRGICTARLCVPNSHAIPQS